ncbi:hypothetical protein [Arenimonas sp. GDDSR-1]|uniref:hypothetical protein n=1 Tax=Arenimonas sp. GDDSR-1 TaxID=2950125 RepID=UPI00263A224E|nr:hypothetical protein [Arenimonas sp. GDDSR-1]
MNTAIDLPNALRQLPLEAPAESAWPGLQRHLPRKPVWPKPAFALAASTVLALLLWQSGTHTDTPPSATTALSAGTADMQVLMDRSAQLEKAFYAQQDDAISSASVIAANIGIEEQLAAIDAGLSQQPSPEDARALWQQRISLLDQGLQLNRTNADFNAAGRNFDLALASTN